jgi:glucokinase
MSKPDYAIGVDVGGQSVKLGLVGEDESLTRVRRQPIDGQTASARDITETVTQAVGELRDEVKSDHPGIVAAGIVFPGIMDRERTRLEFVANLPALSGSAILADLRGRLDLDVIFDADCNAAAYAEYHQATQHNVRRMIGVAVGTGIGAGVIVDGQILRIRNHIAGSLGHVCIDPHGPKCGCGARGCIEALASGLAIMAEANIRADAEPDSRLGRVLKKGQSITGETLADALAAGDPMATDIVHTAGWWLGAGIASWNAIFQPQLVTLGGGIAQLGQPWLDAVREGFRQTARPAEVDALRIEPARLGPDAGIIGAGLLALHHHRVS